MLEKQEGIDRREFTLQAAMAILAGCTIIVAEGCGGSSMQPSPTPQTAAPSDVSGSITANHGHTAMITGAQITTGSAISLNIQGTATHPHTVEISQSDLQSLRNRQAVTHDSTNNGGHTHTVTFTPA
jgi:ABC-type Zn uptake system ZnuABC Zn-binding protein ZnuA